VRGLALQRKPLIVLATRSPRDIGVFPGVRTYVACYNFYGVSIEAAADVIMGDAPARGRLPVKGG
jgi:beta-N-acetylhexosaminidase